MSDEAALHWTSVFATPWLFVPPTDRREGGNLGRRRAGSLESSQVEKPVTQELVGNVPVADLLARLRDGDRDALDILYRAFFKVLWSLALLQTRSGEAAEEIVHDVFLRLWIGRETLQIRGDLRVYLSASVRNAARNLRKHDKIVEAAEPIVQIESPMAGQAAPSDSIEQEEFMTAYRQALTVLTEQERVAAYLRWEEMWPFERIGEVLSLSKVGARKVVLRAQNKVQRLLADFHG